MLCEMKVTRNESGLKDGGGLRRTRIQAEVGHRAGSAQLAAWEYAHGNWLEQTRLTVSGILKKVKKAMGPIPGGTVKDSGDRNRAPVVFGTVVIDSSNNFGVVGDRDVHPGYSIPWNTTRLACI